MKLKKNGEKSDDMNQKRGALNIEIGLELTPVSTRMFKLSNPLRTSEPTFRTYLNSHSHVKTLKS